MLPMLRFADAGFGLGAALGVVPVIPGWLVWRRDHPHRPPPAGPGPSTRGGGPPNPLLARSTGLARRAGSIVPWGAVSSRTLSRRTDRPVPRWPRLRFWAACGGGHGGGHKGYAADPGSCIRTGIHDGVPCDADSRGDSRAPPFWADACLPGRQLPIAESPCSPERTRRGLAVQRMSGYALRVERRASALRCAAAPCGAGTPASAGRLPWGAG